jgi:hypothetical protein
MKHILFVAIAGIALGLSLLVKRPVVESTILTNEAHHCHPSGWAHPFREID